METMFASLISKGKTPVEAKAIIANIDPFNQFAHFLEFIN
jgi:hypothetical protein